MNDLKIAVLSNSTHTIPSSNYMYIANTNFEN